MATPAEPGFKATAEQLLSGEPHLLVVGEIASRHAVPYTTALDWVLDYLDEQFKPESACRVPDKGYPECRVHAPACETPSYAGRRMLPSGSMVKPGFHATSHG